MASKLFKHIVGVAVVVLLASFAVITGLLYNYFARVEQEEMETQLALAARGVELGGEKYLRELSLNGLRLTWIDSSGGVRFDSTRDAETLENHAERKEVREARDYGRGASYRYSATMTEETLYVAERLADNSVLRLARSRSSVWALAAGMVVPLIWVLCIAAVLAGILARRAARSLTDPLMQLDLEHPLDNEDVPEIAPLLTRLARQKEQLGEQMQLLQQQAKEFAEITGHLGEALVLINEHGLILSMNPAACNLFGIPEDGKGKEFLRYERTPAVSAALEQARLTGHGALRLERAGRVYQCDCSRIEAGDARLGTVLLAFDVTEEARAEEKRQEFTANVSHELKTPLQSILGSAELLKSGMVKTEDAPRFAEIIHKEAERMVKLVEDIIKLARLDAGDELQPEKVSLQLLARETLDNLKLAADARHINLELYSPAQGLPYITAPRTLVTEIFTNLIDNAIKYNKEHGAVSVSLQPDEMDGREAVRLTVQDTGIGIPEEEQKRVFERFYRVDKSHSRAIGGTGLGLAIVKHAAQQLNARLTLNSIEGQGTVFTVCFPVADEKD